MNLAIIANPEKYSVKAPFIEILKWADVQGVSVFFDERLNQLYDGKPNAAITTPTEQTAIENADIIIAIGGDGTILYTARLLLTVNKPVLGVNGGRLGFLANTQQEKMVTALNCLAENNFTIKKRFLLHAKTNSGDEHFALNEFLFAKKDPSSMITANAFYDGMFINKYWADGLMVASPTGSTAYNLSSNGPIVMPGSNVMALTPVNPHTLTTRTVILPSSKPLKITIEKQQHEVSFSFDGQSRDIKNYPFEVSIMQSEFTLSLIELPGQNYFDTLRQKLMWGVDYRKRG